MVVQANVYLGKGQTTEIFMLPTLLGFKLLSLTYVVPVHKKEAVFF